ncbi:MAG: hypothetical protein U0T83_06250 [Bacteriovoracaceae bacterium]
MGRRLTLYFICCNTVATWYGEIWSNSIAFEKGIFNFVTQGFLVHYLYSLCLFYRRQVKLKSLTFPELVGEMYGKKSSKLSAVFNFFIIAGGTYD